MLDKKTISLRRIIWPVILMFAASIAAYILTPNYYNVQTNVPDFEILIPRQFGDWKIDDSAAIEVVNPQQKETIDRLYTSTLTRTYINLDGHRIMLSIAYGADQARENRVHLPEVCYPAQGFSISGKTRANMVSADGFKLHVIRLVAEVGSRHEAITYWVRFGNKVVGGAMEQAIVRVVFGLHGNVPDGLLFRVSEINPNKKESFALQDNFIDSLLKNVTSAGRKMLTGENKIH